MNDIAIKVEKLSKRYRIGLKEELPETLVAAMTGWLRSPLANYRQLRRLSQFSEDGHEAEDILWALKDVSFEVKQGEVVGIIGRNGAGKSTLLKILSRITEPTSGRAVINGRVSSLLEVGTGFHSDLTGRENIFLNGTILGMSKAEVDRKFDEIVTFSGVEKFIDTPVKRYSSGMLVRLAFAVAAHLEPEILLVDEVLAVGDAEFQKKCLGKMRDVAREGRTVLFVSHNMLAVQGLCSRGILIEDGGIIMDDAISDVISAYIGTHGYMSTRVDCRYLDHSGSGEAKISSAWISDEDGKERSKFFMGETLIIEFTIETEFPKIRLTHAIEIIDSRGVPILHLWDVDNTHYCEIDGNKRRVKAALENIDLFPDQYNITLWIGTSAARRIDRVEHCLSFSVSQGQYHHRIFSKHRGTIYRLAEWDFYLEL